jgi:hypothetical protein
MLPSMHSLFVGYNGAVGVANSQISLWNGKG